MTSYDRLDWHFDSAIEAGQPPENAFTHIGFYLAWLIRHDLHSPRFFPPDHVEAVKRGAMTGSDLADDIDTKLVSDVMNPEGRAFSDARYGAYMTAYGDEFSDFPDYGVIDDGPNYRRAETLLDRLYAEWIAAGRPMPPPEPPVEYERPMPTGVTVMVPRGYPEDDLARMVEGWGDAAMTVLREPSEAELPHAAPDLESLIPRDLTTPPMEVTSVSASHWGSSLLNRALKRLGARPKDAVVVTGLGGSGEQTLSVALYGVPGAPADQLETEFQAVISKVRGSSWERRVVAGRSVLWATGAEFNIAFWASHGLVIQVAGEPLAMETAISRLR